MGAGNQQGRPDPYYLSGYIAGFVDGEGSFHVAVQKNPTAKFKWQLVPEFHISQHVCNKHVLEIIQGALNCGYVKANHKTNERDLTWVFVVRSRKDLIEKVIPFFRQYPLQTSKKDDFETFAEIVLAMNSGIHLTRSGLSDLLKKAYSMNRSGQYRQIPLERILEDLEPSETVRRTV